MAENLDAIMVIIDDSRLLYETYKLTGNSAKALEMFELVTETNREILSERNQREVLRQEYQYNYDKQAFCLKIFRDILPVVSLIRVK